MSADLKFDTAKPQARQLSAKQKILIPLIILAFAYVIWQLYSMFSTPSVPTAPTKAPVAASSALQQQLPAASSQRPPSSEEQAAVPEARDVSEISPDTDSEQSQYVKLLNQYQILKMKRMLLEEQVAISAARQKIVEMDAKTSELGGDTDFDAGGLGGGGFMLPEGNGGYKVVYIDRQNGEWHATLNYNGRFEEVTVGSELSDGTQIITIDSSGVIIKKGTKLSKLTFSGAAPIEPIQPVRVMPKTSAPAPEDMGEVKAGEVKAVKNESLNASDKSNNHDTGKNGGGPISVKPFLLLQSAHAGQSEKETADFKKKKTEIIAPELLKPQSKDHLLIKHQDQNFAQQDQSRVGDYVKAEPVKQQAKPGVIKIKLISTAATSKPTADVAAVNEPSLITPRVAVKSQNESKKAYFSKVKSVENKVAAFFTGSQKEAKPSENKQQEQNNIDTKATNEQNQAANQNNVKSQEQDKIFKLNEKLLEEALDNGNKGHINGQRNKNIRISLSKKESGNAQNIKNEEFGKNGLGSHPRSFKNSVKNSVIMPAATEVAARNAASKDALKGLLTDLQKNTALKQLSSSKQKSDMRNATMANTVVPIAPVATEDASRNAASKYELKKLLFNMQRKDAIKQLTKGKPENNIENVNMVSENEQQSLAKAKANKKPTEPLVIISNTRSGGVINKKM